MKRLLSSIIGLLSFLAANATTYYASPNGNGNGNSYQTPCSFQEGTGKLQNPGDTLYLLEGQYDLLTTRLELNGSAAANIVISGYPGETAILDFRRTEYGKRGLQISNTSSFLHIKDLTLRYSGKNNLLNEGSNCTFENLDIYGSADTGCQMKNGGNNLIKNVDSHDNFDYAHYGSNGADFGGNADGFADKQHSGAPNHYIGCRAWNNSDDGWDFFDRNTSAFVNSTIIENCICFRNGPAEYNMQGHARYLIDKSFFDSINGSTITNRYGEQQVVTLEHYPNHGNGNGFKLGGNYSTHNVTIHHCLSVENTVKGFDQNNDAGTMRVMNCTGYSNGNDFGFNQRSCGTLYVQNCLSYRSRGANSLQVQTVAANDHNSWNLTGSFSDSDFATADILHILDSRDATGNLPASVTSLFAPASATARMVDKGTAVGYNYYGIAPDWGWQEWKTGEIIDPEPETPYECEEGLHSVAFVSIPGAAEDQLLINYLRASDSLCVQITDANDPNTDYSEYELILVGPKPSSSAAGFTALKGYGKPMLVLKPFLFKQSVWNWGAAQNTQDLSMAIANPAHPVFKGLNLTDGQPVRIFEACNTNAVTGISAWTSCEGIQTLASPVSQPSYCSIAEMPAGSVMNGLTLSNPMLMIGVSEYSTAQLTEDGLRLILNAVCYLLGIDNNTPDAIGNTGAKTTRKIVRDGQIYIEKDGVQYNLLGITAK
ncbi:MAG: right-handed parallel beta-helix repeat-containing protein [Bacteroidales bacterium]|nr:right-handed parallel beta-helix repeat-containing protein [Candidatus Colicola faecequi]